MMGYYNSYGWNSWMLIVMLVWPLVLAGAIWGVIWVTRDRSQTPRVVDESPMDVLRRRFANGDITQQEYLESAAILKNDIGRQAH